MSIKSEKAALDILKTYSGMNPLILRMKRDIIGYQKVSLLNDFAIDYILTNKDREPQLINKTLPVADWYGKSLQEKYEIEFAPAKIKIISYLGDAKSSYHIVGIYRKNMNPMEFFIPKKALLGNFLVKDYHNLEVDFDRYDQLSMTKDPNRRLKPHQKEAVQFLLSRKKCILADDMGVGKTSTLTVAAIEGNFDAVLIICPASLKTNWKKELMWYVPERDITIIDSINAMNKGELESFLGYSAGKSNKTLNELKEEAKDKGQWKDNRFVIINYDILDDFYKIPTSRSKENMALALQASPMLQYIINKKSLIIVDEAHKLSNATSNRSKIISSLIKLGKPDSLYFATGTPITNDPQNLYCVLQFLGDPITDDWKYYMDRYCGAIRIPAKGEKEKYTNQYFNLLNRKNPNRKVESWYDLTSEEKDQLKEYISNNARMITIAKGATNLDELKLRIQHIYLRREKEDINENLPTKTVHELFYDFDMKQLMEYNRLWDDYETAQLEADPDKELNKELLEGAIYRKYCSDQMVPNTIKLVDEFISKGEKVIIATCYDDELYRLKEYYGNKCVVYNGKMNGKQKDAAQKEFMENPDVKVFIGQILAAGVGLTLTVSHIMVFNNIDFVPGNCRQMEDRIYRIGQTKPVDIYYQMFRDTQYERIWKTVMRKELVINQVIKKETEK